MFDSFDHQCMSRALRIAARGLGTTDPNPMVGCVLTNDGEVVGSGWHKRCGESHAEVFALSEAGIRARGATAYVTLEPCSHQGKTPACAPQLIEAGVRRLVCASRDDNPRVNGEGFSLLRNAGIQVDIGLMKEQAESLNAGFFKRMRHDMPWLRVKLAQSIDGGTALSNGQSQWISSEESRADVQSWRARSSAVMTGIGTLLADDPSLNVRRDESCRQPLRIILDSHWRTPVTARTLGLEGKVLIAGLQDIKAPASLVSTGVELLGLPENKGRVDLHLLMQALAERSLNEVQVEAGSTLSGALIAEELVDEVLIYQAPVLLGTGARQAFGFGPLESMENRVRLKWVESVHLGEDLRLRLKPVYGAS
ncbi:MAG: diaminohydroxyphosphoribosylaminopyrimidine deaminase [Lysobacterales bacterium]|jgi:diaminohydroxyphosphoribosylaminopyrimidine deaminase/5-amino-6-(5-phosphoribosylamino)uracil reductase